MRFLIHSNSPTVPTGYGVQVAHLARRLRDAGHDVAVSCTYGLQGKAGGWEGIQLYPSGYQSQSNDVIHNHALHWFKGDPHGGWIIVLTDLWGIVNPLLADFNVIGWCPVDHFPVPDGVLQFFHRTEAVPLSMSRFGHGLMEAGGLEPTYIPLSVDLDDYKPTQTIELLGKTVTGREMMGVPKDAFVVGMVAMNKDPGDRKGFNEAFRAFAAFWRNHNEAVLYVHTDPKGMGTGFNLAELAMHCAIPTHAIVFPDSYAYFNGFSPEMMAAAYTAMDVYLAPSRGEGFCVPLIEAQACGTPVIASDFSAQPELVGAGWLVSGQPSWDPAQSASYVTAYIPDVLDKLEQAFNANRRQLANDAREMAETYSVDAVWEKHWVPFLETLAPSVPLELERDPIPTGPDSVAVIVPAMRRPHNVRPLVESLRGQTDVNVYFVCDPDDELQKRAVLEAVGLHIGVHLMVTDRGHTFAAKANYGFEHTTEPWVFLCGDDVEFTPGWLDAARKLSDRFDVIGTNDAADGNGNASVQNGSHSDHMLVRRSYVDRYGASLDGPGVLCSEVYHHFFVDLELVGLAKARGVFTPCLESVVEHKHPALGKGQSDLVYQRMTSPNALEDRESWLARRPLVDMQRTGRGK